MKDLVNLFSSDWGALRLLVGFVIVPLVYLRDRAEVHKEYAASAKSLSEASRVPQLSEERLQGLRERLHVFELEWWLVGAATVLFMGVFFMGSVARSSDRLQGECTPVAVEDADDAKTLDPCEEVEGTLNVFGLGLALMALFCVRWAKAEAYRELQKDWFDVAGTQLALDHDERGGKPQAEAAQEGA